jgi:hypothetical protein
MNIFAANGAKINVLGWVRLNFTVMGIETSADLLVSEDIQEFMLGYDWLVDQDIVWNFNDKSIAIKGRVVPLKVRRLTRPKLDPFLKRTPLKTPVELEGPALFHSFDGRPLILSGPFAGHVLNPKTGEFGPPGECEAMEAREEKEKEDREEKEKEDREVILPPSPKTVRWATPMVQEVQFVSEGASSSKGRAHSGWPSRVGQLRAELGAGHWPVRRGDWGGLDPPRRWWKKKRFRPHRHVRRAGFYPRPRYGFRHDADFWGKTAREYEVDRTHPMEWGRNENFPMSDY